ncbi:sialoadhesin-like [Rhincodon typus]|uniref:sialoadhesin-like n=1 Tax=Rhincodon typus TaxID=259920 RepID=UPI0020306382|nr:sialoadhesin-like [Rhincodon typus]
MMWFLLLYLLPSSAWGNFYSVWSVNAPRAVEGAEGSCLIIPCQCRYPRNSNLQTAMWLKGEKVNGILVISSNGDTDPSFQNRATLTGNKQIGKDCTLKITDLQKSDEGTYHFRMSDQNRENYSDPNGVSIKVVDVSELIKISDPGEVLENVEVSLNCSVSFLCPGLLKWFDTEGLNISSSTASSRPEISKPASSTILKFTPSYRDNGRTLSCGFKTASGEIHNATTTLNVLYAPKDVYIDSSQLIPYRWNQYVTLYCLVTSSNPPVQSFTWYMGTTVFREHLPRKQFRVSYDSSPVRCEAANSLGKTSSDEVKLVTLQPGTWGVWSPLAVRARTGSCAVIPCEFKHPTTISDKVKKIAMWLQDHHYHGNKVYHNEEVGQADYRRRVEFLGNLENGNCTLKVKNLTSNDSRNYYFRIEMGEHKWSQQTGSRLMVSDLPEKPVIQAPVTVTEGLPTTMSCSVHSPCPEDIPDLKWVTPFFSEVSEIRKTYQDNCWTYSRTMSFTPGFEDRDLSLRCVACFGTDTPPVDSEVTVNLQYKPRNVSISLTRGTQQGNLKEGDSVTLECDALHSQPAVTSYIWYKDGTQLSSSWRQPLEIRRISYSQFGKYFCEAENGIGRGRSEDIEVRGQCKCTELCLGAVLTTESNWTIDLPGTLTVQPGLCAVVPCNFQHVGNVNTTQVQISWYKLSQVLPNRTITQQDSVHQEYKSLSGLNSTLMQIDCSLRISPITDQNTGIYQVTIQLSETNLTYQSSSLNLTITGALKPNISSMGIIVQNNLTTLSCTFHDVCDEPGVNLTWINITSLNLSAPVGESHWDKARSLINSSISFLPSANDNGKVIGCLINYPNASLQSLQTLPLDVKYGPDIPEMRQVTVQEMESVQVECIVNSNPVSTIRWYRGNESILSAVNDTLYLNIDNVTSRDSGVYICQAWNLIGKAERKVNITVQCEYLM